MEGALIKSLLVYIIKNYQEHTPERYRGNCRFTPTCSEYAIQADLPPNIGPLFKLVL
ncbi:MAG: membrane protein insertion efficiency factor YidD [Candidatus Marinimicrobia bacterium]|nr:membrane protein insertion efficiency factor YidD [Candidatus Neomarinimicrobiota bacterium]